MIAICKGIPGGTGAHRVADLDDLIAGICEQCEKSLTGAKSWGSASPAQAKANGKGSPMVINERKHKSKTQKDEWRNYPDGK